MPSKRDLKLDEYDIGKYAYRELHNFCLQYPEKKKRLAKLQSPYLKPMGISEKSGASGYVVDNKDRMASLLADCELIEQVAIEAGGGNDYQCLLLAVTQDVPHHYLKLLKGLQTGEKKFVHSKRYFYYLLARKKNIL